MWNIFDICFCSGRCELLQGTLCQVYDGLVSPPSVVTQLTCSCSSVCHASDSSPVYGVSDKYGIAFSHDSRALCSKACGFAQLPKAVQNTLHKFGQAVLVM